MRTQGGKGHAMHADQLEKIADALIRSYDLDQAERPPLPDREAVVCALDDIRRILFPGYYAAQRLPTESRSHYICTWLCQLESELTRIIALCFAHGEDLGRKKVERQASELSARFLMELPRLREELRRDAEAALAGDPACLLYTSPSPRDATLSRMPSSA